VGRIVLKNLEYYFVYFVRQNLLRRGGTMKRSHWRWVQRHLVQSAALAAIATGCGQGNGGCALTDGIQPLAAPLPKEAILENGIQIRLTNQGFTFVEQNLGTIVETLIGDHICIPASSFGSFAGFEPCPVSPNEEANPICDGAPGCRVDFNIDSTDFELDQSGTTALLRTQIQMDFAAAGNGVPVDAPFGQTCDAQLSGNNFFADATIALSINATTRQLTVGLADVNLADLIDQLVINVTSENGADPIFGSSCSIADFGVDIIQGLGGILVGLFEDQVTGLLSDQIQNFVPNPPGIEGRIDLGSLLGGALPIPIQGQFELSMVAGGYVNSETSNGVLGNDPAQRGLSFGMRAGINSDFTPFNAADGRSTPNPCVRTLPLPLPGVPNQAAGFTAERFLQRANEFAENTIPLTNTAYDAGIGISQGFLNNFGFHMFNSGMLCIGVGSETVGAGLLSSETLGLLLPSLKDLIKTPGGVMPVFIQLRPQTAPTVIVGDGTANDPLIRLSIKNMELDLFALVDDRLARLFTATTSFDLGVNIVVDAAAGTIIPTLDTSQLLGLTVQVTNSEMLAEPAASIQNILPTLISVALPALANVIGPITPPSVGGFSLDLTRTSIQRVQANLGNIGNENFLAIFAGLVFDINGGKMAFASDPISIKAKLAGVQLPTDFAISNRLELSSLPGVALHLEGNDNNLEWQFRVNNGLWTPYTQEQNPVLRQPIFMLQGEHTIEVRGRVIGHPETVSAISVVKARIDTIAPIVKLTPLDDGSIRATISDVGTNVNELEKSFRVDSNDWTPLPDSGVITPEMLGNGLTVEVQVTDKSEHTVLKAIDRIRGAGLAPTTAACSVSQESNGYNVLFALGAMVGFLLVIRRRRYQGLGAALMVAAAITSEGCACGGVVCAIDGDCGGISCGVGEAGFCGPEGFCECGEVIIKNGDVGRFSDIASNSSEAVIVAYNTSFGDLILARVTPDSPVENGVAKTSLNDFEFIYVDGVPSGPVVGDPNKTRNGIRDAGENVGQDASVVLDSQGNAHIAYLDVDKGNLKYARVGADNTVQAVMAVDTDAFTGRYTDIIIGDNGSPQISYMAPNVGGFSQLRFVAADNTNPTSSADWQQPIIVDSLAVVAPDPVTLLDFPKGTGLFTSMALRADGRTRINYFDSINGNLKRTQTTSAAPTDFAEMATLDDPNNPDDGGVTNLDEAADGSDLGKIGKYASLFVDGSDGFHQVELNEDNSTLLYFGTASNFVIENVDNGVRDAGGNPIQHKIGGDATVVGATINGTDRLFVAYHDGTGLDVNISERNADGTWTVHTISGNELAFEGSKGFFTAITIAGNNPSIAFLVNYVLNQQTEETNFEVITVDLTQMP
jgi:hypothetical protein